MFGIRENRISKILTDNKRANLIEAEKQLMKAKIFNRIVTTAEKQEMMKSNMSSANFGSQGSSLQQLDDIEEKTYSMQELLEMNPKKLEKMTFEIKNNNQGQVPYVKIFAKTYSNNNTIKKMVKIIDVTKNIMYDQVFAENEFLSITNATVSHELRNPLQSISSQNLKIKLCLKELLSIIGLGKNKTVKEIEP